jgi:hypothetical protein
VWEGLSVHPWVQQYVMLGRLAQADEGGVGGMGAGGMGAGGGVVLVLMMLAPW